MFTEQEIIASIKKNYTNQIRGNFSGFGIVIYKDTITRLPISPLRKDTKPLADIDKNVETTINFLYEISGWDDARHDGFHFIKVNFGLTHVSQYFSPPIPSNFRHTTYNIGARYRTAQYGSLLSDVLSVIVLNKDGLLHILKQGKEVI